MTAAERLKLLAGTTGAAAALLLAIGQGATTGEALNAYSTIEAGTAAEHLLSERAVAHWDTRQGVSPFKFTPIHDVETKVIGCGAYAGTGAVAVEGSQVTEVWVGGSGSYASSSCVSVVASSVVDVSTQGATSGSASPYVTTGSTITVPSFSGRGASGVVRVSGSAEAIPNSARALSGSVARLTVLAIQNPSDEELLLLFRRLTS